MIFIMMFLIFKNICRLKQNYLLFYFAIQMDFSRLDMTADRYHILQGQLDTQDSFGSQTLPTTMINCS